MRLSAGSLRVKILQCEKPFSISNCTHFWRSPADATQERLTHAAIPLLRKAKVDKNRHVLNGQQHVGRLDVVVGCMLVESLSTLLLTDASLVEVSDCTSKLAEVRASTGFRNVDRHEFGEVLHDDTGHEIQR